MVETHNLDFECHNIQDITPLDIALGNGKLDDDVADYFNHKRLHQAVISGQAEEAKVILGTAQPKLDINRFTDKKGTTYLSLACENQNLPLIRLLLESNASIQGLRPHGRTLLLTACSRGHLPVAKALVEHRANVKAVDDDGYGALHLACLSGHRSMAKYLVESCKVDIEAVSEQGTLNRFHMYCGAVATIETVTLLSGGKTPLLIASDRGHVQLTTCLVELKADVKTGDCNGMCKP
eukprot:1326754-Amorphochlora_amoeboformis.AAC.2